MKKNLIQKQDVKWIIFWIVLIVISFMFDNQILAFIDAIQTYWLTIVFGAITYTMTLSWGLAVIVLMIGFLADRKTFFGSVISLLATMGIAFLLKAFVPRIRPNMSSDSFPSGHSSRAFALAGYMEKVFSQKYFYALAALVALSRVYLLHHYASDAVVGAFIGIVVAEVVFRLDLGKKIEKLLKF